MGETYAPKVTADDGQGFDGMVWVPAGNVRLRSVFMPKSLFADTDDAVTDVMTYACNKWILNTLRGALAER